jgi:hypothetical protein
VSGKTTESMDSIVKEVQIAANQRNTKGMVSSIRRPTKSTRPATAPIRDRESKTNIYRGEN